MKKLLFALIGLIIFASVGCTKELTGDEKTAADYVKVQGYKITSYNGEIHKYTLEKNLLHGTTENIPYQQAWGVQTVEPDEYFGKQIIVYGFTVKNHPLQKRSTNAKNGVGLSIMVSDGKVIGGFSYPAVPTAGGVYSLDGKTSEEVTGLSYQQRSENWRKKYGN